MSRYRIRVNDEDESGPGGLLLLAAGALAGFAAGVYLSQRFGGVAGVTAKLRSRFRAEPGDEHEDHDQQYEDEEEELDEGVFVSANEELEERVLSAFTNDPTLRERAVDIGAVAEHTIELTGHVFTTAESEHATVMARGVPGVDVVVNRLHVRRDEQAEHSAAQPSTDDDPQYADSKWGAEDIPDASERRPTFYDSQTAQESRPEAPPSA
jgi:BON domain